MALVSEREVEGRLGGAVWISEGGRDGPRKQRRKESRGTGRVLRAQLEESGDRERGLSIQ